MANSANQKSIALLEAIWSQKGGRNNGVDSAWTVSSLDMALSALIMALIPLAKDPQLEPLFHVVFSLSGGCQVAPGVLYGWAVENDENIVSEPA